MGFDRWRSRRRIKAAWTVAPSHSADELADMMYAHFLHWPEEHSRLQPLIKAGFLKYFPGADGDVFRNMVWPPPLYDYTSGVGG